MVSSTATTIRTVRAIERAVEFGTLGHAACYSPPTRSLLAS